MKIFISGGCKNGKSSYAQQLAQDAARRFHAPLYYLATMQPHDEEDLARIARHRRERAGMGFATVEQGTDLCQALERAEERGVFLLDSLTALVANEMFSDDGSMDLQAGQRVAHDLQLFLHRVEHAVVVSDFLYADVGFYEGQTGDYLRALAQCDRVAASLCDCVIEVSAACIFCHKGALPCG